MPALYSINEADESGFQHAEIVLHDVTLTSGSFDEAEMALKFI